MTLLIVILLGVAVLLIYSAIKGESPVDVVKRSIRKEA